MICCGSNQTASRRSAGFFFCPAAQKRTLSQNCCVSVGLFLFSPRRARDGVDWLRSIAPSLHSWRRLCTRGPCAYLMSTSQDKNREKGARWDSAGLAAPPSVKSLEGDRRAGWRLRGCFPRPLDLYCRRKGELLHPKRTCALLPAFFFLGSLGTRSRYSGRFVRWVATTAPSVLNYGYQCIFFY